MLQITIPAPKSEQWDEKKEEFVYTTHGKDTTLSLEHSLVSISKWESKWHKSWIDSKDKTDEETIDYIRCMTITQNVDPEVYSRLTRENINKINEYINDPMTAVYFPQEKNKKKSRDTVTSELIYYWMISQNIPVEFQKWHLNRLLALIRVCSMKNDPGKKMSTNELMRRNTDINKARRAMMKSKG